MMADDDKNGRCGGADQLQTFPNLGIVAMGLAKWTSVYFMVYSGGQIWYNRAYFFVGF